MEEVSGSIPLNSTSTTDDRSSPALDAATVAYGFLNFVGRSGEVDDATLAVLNDLAARWVAALPDDVPSELCPNCGRQTLTPVDDVFTGVERAVLEGIERWACTCGYAEDRDESG
jgi:hypothetical protein